MPINSEFSIIIPAYNRAWCVGRALSSAVQFIGPSINAEIVLVDDGSVDSTLDEIHKSVASYSDSANISFRICCHEKNRGVCAAKNTGARAAVGVWLVFFDSDDELMPGGLARLQSCLSHSGGEMIHFFTAIKESAEFDFESIDRVQKRGFREYLVAGLGGEALPVIQREIFLRFPYDEDVRGYESLAYMRLVKSCGSLVLHSLGLRRYYTSNADRLSTKANMRKRRTDLMTGHLRAFREHYRQAPVLWSVKQALRTFYAVIR